VITGVSTNNNVLVIPGKIAYQGRERIVRAIGVGAFEDKQFTQVVFPPSLRVIGDRAFARNQAIRSLDFPRNSELVAICDEAFRECTGLITVNLPYSVRALGNRTFMNCTSLRTVRQDEPSGGLIPDLLRRVANFLDR
jgi:hypothetical protein